MAFLVCGFPISGPPSTRRDLWFVQVSKLFSFRDCPVVEISEKFLRWLCAVVNSLILCFPPQTPVRDRLRSQEESRYLTNKLTLSCFAASCCEMIPLFDQCDELAPRWFVFFSSKVLVLDFFTPAISPAVFTGRPWLDNRPLD